jgi:predicted PurR-regulated permease PerM
MNAQEPCPDKLPRGRLALLVLLAGALYLAFRIVKPFLHPILLAVILAPLLHPVYGWIRSRLRGNSGLAALLTCVLLVLVMLGPLAVVVTALIAQGVESVQAVQGWVESGRLNELLATPWVERLRPLMQKYLPLIDPDRVDLAALLVGASKNVGSFLLAKGGVLLSGTGWLLSQMLLMLFVLFYLLCEGEQLLAHLRQLSPLRASQDQLLIERFRAVSRSAVLGTFATAIAQGIAGGIGLAIVGIPGLFWGAMMALASLIPVAGTTLIWGPAAIYLLLAGRPWAALFLVLYSAIVVGSIDNFLRPLLMKGEAGMSTVFLFFAILGGMQAFGLLGVIYGPVVVALCAALLSLYEAEYRDFLEVQAKR